MAGGTTPAHVTQLSQGLDRRARHRRVGRCLPKRMSSSSPLGRSCAIATPSDGSRRSCWRRRARSDRRRNGPVRHGARRRGSSTRVSRSCSARVTRSRAQAAALELGCIGATNADASEDADLVDPRDERRCGSRHRARAPRARSARRPCSPSRPSCSSRRRASSRRPTPASLAARIQAELAGPVVAGLHSLAAASLGGDEPPDEDAFVCGDDAGRQGARARDRRAAHVRACARRRARSRALALSRGSSR